MIKTENKIEYNPAEDFARAMTFEKVIQAAKEGVQLIIQESFPGKACVGGKYSIADHTITLYEEDIALQCRRMLGSLDRLEEYTWVILAHELGHAMDDQLEQLSEKFFEEKSQETLYQIEINAWENAQKVIPFIDMELFDSIKGEALSHCFQRLERMA